MATTVAHRFDVVARVIDIVVADLLGGSGWPRAHSRVHAHVRSGTVGRATSRVRKCGATWACVNGAFPSSTSSCVYPLGDCVPVDLRAVCLVRAIGG
eukprot:4939915-Prymnesium_polylepis.1